MADQKISDLTALTNAAAATDDVIAIVDTSAVETKKISLSELDTRFASSPFAASDITGQTLVTAAATDSIVITDASDADGLKKVTAQTVADLRTLASADISGQTSVTAAAADELLIIDASDSSNLKRVTTQSIADLLSPTFTDESLTVGGGGSFTYTTDYNRFFIFGKILFWQFSITQTAAGSGTTDLTFPAPTGVTLLDSKNCGMASTNDIGNNNLLEVMACESFATGNQLKVQNNDTALYLRGGNMIGNNAVVNISANICTEIA